MVLIAIGFVRPLKHFLNGAFEEFKILAVLSHFSLGILSVGSILNARI